MKKSQHGRSGAARGVFVRGSGPHPLYADAPPVPPCCCPYRDVRPRRRGRARISECVPPFRPFSPTPRARRSCRPGIIDGHASPAGTEQPKRHESASHSDESFSFAFGRDYHLNAFYTQKALSRVTPPWALSPRWGTAQIGSVTRADDASSRQSND